MNQEGIPSPAAYLILKGISKEKSFQNSYWNRTNVKRLLTNRMYLGNLVYGKEQSSFAKGITRHRLPEEQWKEVENTHEPIIDRKLFAFVQEKQEETVNFLILCRKSRRKAEKNFLTEQELMMTISLKISSAD